MSVLRVATWSSWSTLLVAGMLALTSFQGARASTAGMGAQQIPLGLLEDITSLTRFPNSALRLDTGLQGDLESAGTGVRSFLFKMGSARAGLIWIYGDDYLEQHENGLQGVLAWPVGSLNVGLAVGGWMVQTKQESSLSGSATTNETRNAHCQATMGVGIPRGRRSRLELAVTGGYAYSESDYERLTADTLGLWVLSDALDEEPDAGLSYRSDLRWSAGVGDEARLNGWISYLSADGGRAADELHDGSLIAQARLRDEYEVWQGVVALERPGPRGGRVIAGLALRYAEEVTDRRSSSGALRVERRWLFETQAKAFIGLEMSLRRWISLYGGLAGRYNSSNTIRKDQYRSRMEDWEGANLSSTVSGGLKLSHRDVFADAQLHNSISSHDPFVILSLGYRF